MLWRFEEKLAGRTLSAENCATLSFAMNKKTSLFSLRPRDAWKMLLGILQESGLIDSGSVLTETAVSGMGV